MSTERRRVAIAAGVLALAASGCGGGDPPDSEPDAADPSPVAASAPMSLADIFPEGLGRDLVIESCGGCHAVACSAIGQRTAARWKALEIDHSDRVADMGEEDYRLVFAYLSENFHDGRPEPVIPPEFLAGGCAPF